MKLHYDFGGYDYEYEPDEDDLKKQIISLLCKNVKSINKEIYEEDGAYQMCVYMLKLLEKDLDYDVVENIGGWFQEELEDKFYKKAIEEFNYQIGTQENDAWYDAHRHD